MKVAVILFALMGASSALLPEGELVETVDPLVPTRRFGFRFVDNIISAVIENISKQMREQGLDPFIRDTVKERIGLPVPSLFNLDINGNTIRVDGLSDIVINHISFGLFSLRLSLNISLPEIMIIIGNANLDATILGYDGNVNISNVRLAIRNINIAGDMQFSLSVVGGISASDTDLKFNLDQIRYIGLVNVLGNDVSTPIYNLINHWIPHQLDYLRDDIDELVNIIAVQVIDSLI